MELLTKLGVDVNLLVAQVVNFTILLCILTYFVYRPLLHLLDSRSERIRKAMEGAKRMEAQEEEMERLRRSELAKIDSECGVYMERIRKQAELLEKDIVARGKSEAEVILERARKKVEEERREMLTQAMAHLSSLIVQTSERVLQREFSSSDEQRVLAAVERDLPKLIQ